MISWCERPSGAWGPGGAPLLAAFRVPPRVAIDGRG